MVCCLISYANIRQRNGTCKFFRNKIQKFCIFRIWAHWAQGVQGKKMCRSCPLHEHTSKHTGGRLPPICNKTTDKGKQFFGTPDNLGDKKNKGRITAALAKCSIYE